MHAQRFHRTCFIGDGAQIAHIKRALQQGRLKKLRRLRLPQAGARHGGADMLRRIGTFERVGHGHGQYAAFGLTARFLNQAAQGFGRQAAAGGIVHQNIVVRRGQALLQQSSQAVAHGFGAGFAAAFQHAELMI